MGGLPQELIDLIVDFLPLDVSLTSTPDYYDVHNLVNCTLVSRSFGQPARRRLFTKIEVGAYSDLSLLKKILRDKYIRLSVRILHIVIDKFDGDGEGSGENVSDSSSSSSSSSMDDSDLADITGALVACNVRHLVLEAAYGDGVVIEDVCQYSMPNLKKLVTHLEVLTLWGDMVVSSSLLEHKYHLERLQVLGSTLSGTSAARLPQTQVNELFIRPSSTVDVSTATSGGLPTFTAARIELSIDEQGCDPIVPSLAQSSLSLRTLEVIAVATWFPSSVGFSRFQNLRTVRYCAEYDNIGRVDVVVSMMVFLDKIAKQLETTPSSSIEELEVRLIVLKETDLSVTASSGHKEETKRQVWRTYLRALEPARLRSTYTQLRSLRISVDLHQMREPRRFARDAVADWASLEGQIAAHIRAQFIGAIFGDPDATLPTTRPTTCEIAVIWMAAEPPRENASYYWKS